MPGTLHLSYLAIFIHLLSIAYHLCHLTSVGRQTVVWCAVTFTMCALCSQQKWFINTLHLGNCIMLLFTGCRPFISRRGMVTSDDSVLGLVSLVIEWSSWEPMISVWNIMVMYTLNTIPACRLPCRHHCLSETMHRKHTVALGTNLVGLDWVSGHLCQCSVHCLAAYVVLHSSSLNTTHSARNLGFHWHPMKISRTLSEGNPSAGRVKHKPSIAFSDLSTAIYRKRCRIGGKLVLITNRKS